jgi:hypothetical protein
MANQPRAQLRIATPDGFVVDTFTQATLKDSFTDPLGHLDLHIAPPLARWNDYRTRLDRGAEVRVYVNSACQGRYLVVSAKRRYSAKTGCTLQIQCESLLTTAHEANVNPDYTIRSKSATSIEAVVRQVLAPYYPPGFPITTDGRARAEALSGKPLPGGTAPPFVVSDLKTKAAVAKEGENCVAFINKIVTRLGVVMRDDGNGGIILGTANYTQGRSWSLGMSTQPGLGSEFNLFYGDIEVETTNKQAFSQASVIGQAGQQGPPPGTSGAAFNASRPKSPVTLASDVLPTLCVYKSATHPTKPLIYKDKHSSDPTKCTAAAQLVLGKHAVHAYQVKGWTVDGWLTKSGAVWSVDTQGRLAIVPEGLDATFWMLERTLHLDVSGGQRTSGILIPSGALILGPSPGST